jgi:signal transduction histidine kinase
LRLRETNQALGSGLAFSLLIVAGLLWAPRSGNASCFAEVTGGDAPFAALMESDPRAAIAQIQTEILRTPAGSNVALSRAHLYAMLMDAYQNSGEIALARDASAHGIQALTTVDGPGLRHRLLFTEIMLNQVQGHIAQAAADYEQAAQSVPDDSPDLVCVLGDRGYLRFLVGGRIDAAVDAMRAYRLAGDLGLGQIRLSAGQLLARLYAQYGLYDEALKLADDGVAFYLHAPNKVLLSDAYLFRGDIFVNKEDYSAAEADFLKSRALLEVAGDRFAQSFTLQRLCLVAAKMPNHSDAPTTCHGAYELANAVKNPISAKLVLVALGQIEFGKGHDKEAIGLWDRALAEDGVDLPKRTRSTIYSLRAQAKQRLGDTVGALRDISLHVNSLENERQARSADQSALLKLMMDSALKSEELAKVRAEARVAEMAISRQTFIRNLFIAATILLIAMVPLGMWSWHRRKVVVPRRAAEARLVALGQLTGGIAHDFNNLLGVLYQTIGLLARRESVAQDPVALDLVQQAQQAGEIGADITKQLLSFARQQNLKPEAVNMSAFLLDARPLLERAAGTTMTVHVETQDATSVAWVDRRQLTAALLNLVANSRDAKSDTFIVRTYTDAGRRIRIDAIDRGCGMTPAVLARALEPFYSTKAVGAGSGLGLSTVQGFVSQSSGSLKIISESNRGTTVSLWLPSVGASHG